MLPLELLGGGAKPSKAVWENNSKNLIANRWKLRKPKRNPFVSVVSCVVS